MKDSIRQMTMTRRWAVGFAASVALLCDAPALSANEVTLAHKGLTLNANLELADGRSLADGVVLITHGALAHAKMEFIVYLQQLLKQKHLSSLAINLSLSLDRRSGMYDCKIPHRHRNEDAAQEIRAWMSWLLAQGVKNVVLLGHSRGGAQTALAAANLEGEAIPAVILLAPATAKNGAEGYASRYGHELAPVLKHAQNLIAQGKGETLLEHVGIMTCRDTTASAISFESYYNGGADLDAVALIPRIKRPVLVVAASADETVVNLVDQLAPIRNTPQLSIKVIENADHLFRDLNADEAVDAIADFLAALPPSSKSFQTQRRMQ